MKENETEDERIERIVRKVVTKEVKDIKDMLLWYLGCFLLIVFFLACTFTIYDYLMNAPIFGADTENQKFGVFAISFLFSGLITVGTAYNVGLIWLCIVFIRSIIEIIRERFS